MAPGWTGMVFVALCLLWHLCSGVSTEATVSQPQSSVTGDAGDSVTLNCTVSLSELGPVKWSRGTGPQKQQLDIKPAETPGHISWASGNHPTDKSIVISELSLRDSGVYYCEWYRPSQDQPSVSGSGTTLTVRGKPIITPPAGRASPGERVSLSCESEGAGNTSLSWDRDGQSQTGVQERHLTDRSRSSLTLTAAPSFITSTVRCLIPPATGKDTPVSTALQLQDFITVPPAVKVTGQTQLVLGQSASLTCQLSGFYPASWTLQWLLNDKTLGPQAGTQISRTEPQPSEEGTFTQSSLVQLTGSLELRAAALVCQAEFKGKHTERDSITLRVRGSPKITASEKRVKAGDDLTLNCESVGDTDTPLSWRVGMKNMSGEQSHLPSSSFQGTSSSLTLRADKSFIRETVFCEIPETNLSASLRLESVLTVPPAVKVTGQTQLVLGQSASLTCQLSGFYPASWTLQWLLNDKTLGTQAGKQISRTEPQPSEEGTFTQSSLVQLTGSLELRAAALVCQAEFKGKHSERDSITLRVRGSPNITAPEKRVKVGDDLTLRCESVGDTDTPLSWRVGMKIMPGVQSHLPSSSFQGTSSSLTLRADKSFIRETVFCEIPETDLSASLRLESVLTVPPAVKVTGQTQLVLGQSASLTCQLSGFYPASWTLQWLLNDKTLGPQAGTQISRTEPQPSEEGTFTQSSLVQLTGSLELRAAALVCQAEFKGKHSERDSITLRVRGSPHITAPEKRVKAGDDLTLNCESLGDTDTPLSWRVGMKIMSGEQSRLPSSSFQGTSSSLTLRADKIFIRETVFCEIPETNFSASLRLESVLTVVPTVKIKSQNELFLNQTVNISCLVSGFFPHNVSVSWEPMTLSRTPVQDQNCTKIQNQDGTYTAELWAWFLFTEELNGSAVSCVSIYEQLWRQSDNITLRERKRPENIPDTRQQDEGPSTVLLYAGVACGIILFLVTVALLMYCKRRGEQHKPEDSSPADGGAVLREPEITYAALDMKKLKPKAAPPAGQDRTGQGEDPTEVTYAALDLKRLPKPRAAPPAGEESTVYAEVKGARGRKAISESRTPPASLASESTEYASINFRRKTRRGQDSVLYY